MSTVIDAPTPEVTDPAPQPITDRTCGFCGGTGKVLFGLTKIDCLRCGGTGTVGEG
jgi:DnaJ-class molecular chaperone